jgi:hypothetical protein
MEASLRQDPKKKRENRKPAKKPRASERGNHEFTRIVTNQAEEKRQAWARAEPMLCSFARKTHLLSPYSLYSLWLNPLAKPRRGDLPRAPAVD